MEITFAPYVNYRQSIAHIDKFAELSTLSYGLAQQLLRRHTPEEVSSFAPKVAQVDLKNASFSMADVSLGRVEMTRGWLPLSEYAKRVELPLEDIASQARDGKLGPISKHPHSGADMVVWPPECQHLDPEKIPAPGRSQYSVQLKIEAGVPKEIDPADSELFEQTQKQLLHHAHALGDPEEAGERAEDMLWRACFLLRWTSFEVFLRESIHELLKRHPERLVTTRNKKEKVTYEELLAMTDSLSSVDKLRAQLVEREIERQQAAGEPVTGLINFLKSAFPFESDPYNAWYVYRGDERKAGHDAITRLRLVRNALLHDGGRPSASLLSRYPELRPRDGVLVLDDEEYRCAVLVLDSVAYSIADSVQQKKYIVG